MCDEDLVKVAVRVRPLLSNETSKGARDIVKHPRDEQVSIENTAARSDNDRTKTFSYDHVFKETSTQQDVYDEAASKMVKNIFEGFNVTIIAYGQTGSGKTYTMGTTPKDKGIIHRFVTDTFTGLEKLAGSEEEKMTFEAEVRLLEIHNEILTDLLHDDEKRKSTISIREDAGGKNVISGLVREPVRSADDVVTCLRRGGELRATASTAMNDQSSRSHMVLFLDLVMKRPLTSNNEVEVDTLIPCDEIRSRITFVDLAGSERLKKTGATGKTRKEGIDINRGLLALGNVINALGDDRRRAGHVNYRDSKLTRILQDSLGGNSRTLFVACISPSDTNAEETLNTLRYANRARRIRNKSVVNRNSHAAQMLKFTKQIVSLQRALALTVVLTTTEKDDTIPAPLRSYVEKEQEEDGGDKLLRLTDSFLQREPSKRFLQKLLERIGSARSSSVLGTKVPADDLFVSSSALYNPSPRKRRRREAEVDENDDVVIVNRVSKSQMHTTTTKKKLYNEEEDDNNDDDDDDDHDDLPIECLDLLMKQERVRIAAKAEDDRCEEKVQEVDAAIECNEKILVAIKERLKKYETMKSSVANLTEAIRDLTKERDELRRVKNKSSSTEKIARLTDQLKEMKRKQRANQKELRNAESCARRAKSLENLIVRLKTSKIQMQKRAKDRARQHRENMSSLGKQIRKLRNAHAKQQRKMSGLKHKHARTALKLERREKVYGRTKEALAVTKQRLLALLNHRRRQALRGRRRRPPRSRAVEDGETTTTTTTETSPQELEAIRVLLDSNIEDTARVTFSESAREENLRQRMRLLEDILLISEDIEVAEKRLAELEKEKRLSDLEPEKNEDDRTEAIVLSRQKAEMETRLQSLQERLRLCDAVVDETERALKDGEEKPPLSSTEVVESLSKEALHTLVHDLVQRASDSRAAELLANQSQEMSETRRELAIHARDTAWKELSAERKSQRAEIRKIHSTYQEELVSGDTLPSWITKQIKEHEMEIERLKSELLSKSTTETTNTGIVVENWKGAALPKIAQDIGVSSDEISNSLREEITRRQQDHEKIWTERRDVLSRCVEEGLKLLNSLRRPLGEDVVVVDDEKSNLILKWNRIHDQLVSTFETLTSRSRRLQTCTSEIIRMRKEFEEDFRSNVVPDCVSKLANFSSTVLSLPEKISFKTLLSKHYESKLSFHSCLSEISSLSNSVEQGLLCTKNASCWESEMRDLSVRRAKRLRDVKMLIESLRGNIKLLGSKEGERIVRDHFENDSRVVSIYTSASDDRVFEITLSSKSYDLLKEMSTLLSSNVESRRALLRDHRACVEKIRNVLRSEEKKEEEKNRRSDDEMISRLSDLSKELVQRCKDLVRMKPRIRKTLCDLYIQAGKSEDNALDATERFWSENVSISETVAADRMKELMNTFVCLMMNEDDESHEYGVYASVWNGLFDTSIRKRFLISREYHDTMFDVCRHLAMLQKCRLEEVRLETKIRSRQSIVDQLSKVRDMEAKMREFETMASDSSRLLRGSSLARLEEERFRVRYAKLHPKRLASIASAVETWEKENDGETFMLEGVSLADAIEKVRQKLLPLELSLRGAGILGDLGDDDDKSVEDVSVEDTSGKRHGRRSQGGEKKKTRRRSSQGKENESKIARPSSRRTSGELKKKKISRSSSSRVGKSSTSGSRVRNSSTRSSTRSSSSSSGGSNSRSTRATTSRRR